MTRFSFMPAVAVASLSLAMSCGAQTPAASAANLAQLPEDSPNISKAPDLGPNIYSDVPEFAVSSAANVLLLDALNTPRLPAHRRS